MCIRDRRNRPTVSLPGRLMLGETPSRRSAAAHYPPRVLAEEVVEHALAPLVYSPGPHQTGDREAWRLVSSEEILGLKVADIACGSGAFLVAAARYLARRLVEAWEVQGDARGHPPERLELEATREVVARCLYGADINPMAVEMCKLSLWLVSLDPKLPFSFVDDKLFVGNSLLGLTDVRQIEELHLDPETGHRQEAWQLTLDNTLLPVSYTHLDVYKRQVEDLRRLFADGWAQTPIDAMTEMLRAAEVPIGLVTDGRWWGLVSVPRPNTPTAAKPAGDDLSLIHI